MDVERSLRGAAAGAVAAAAWAGQQPLDKRVFGTGYDDVELLGKLVTRGDAWPLAGAAMHLQNGALFGATYATLKPLLPGPPPVRGLIVGLAEHFAGWPLSKLVDRHHPRRRELTRLWGNHRAFAQALWRHALFGLVLGALEHRLNGHPLPAPGQVPASTNGHGDLDLVAESPRL